MRSLHDESSHSIIIYGVNICKDKAEISLCSSGVLSEHVQGETGMVAIPRWFKDFFLNSM